MSPSENAEPTKKPVVPSRRQFCFRTISDLPVYMNFGFDYPIINPPALIKVSVNVNITQEDPNSSYKTYMVEYIMRPQSDPCPSHFYISNGQSPFSNIYVEIKLHNGLRNKEFTKFIFNIKSTAPEVVQEIPDTYGLGVVSIKLYKDRSHPLEYMPTLRRKKLISYLSEESFQKKCIILLRKQRKFILIASMEEEGPFPIYFSITITARRLQQIAESITEYTAWPIECPEDVQEWTLKKVIISGTPELSVTFTLHHIITEESIIYFSKSVTNYATTYKKLIVPDVKFIKFSEETHEISDSRKLFLISRYVKEYKCSNGDKMNTYRPKIGQDDYEIQMERHLTLPGNQYSYISKTLEKTKDLCSNPQEI